MSDSLRTASTQGTEAIACPSWCVDHEDGERSPGDPVLHTGEDAFFTGSAPDRERLRIGISGELMPAGSPVPDGEWPPRIDIGDKLLSPSDARRVAAHLLNLADAAERPVHGAG